MQEVVGLSLANGIKLGFVAGDELTFSILSSSENNAIEPSRRSDDKNNPPK